MILSGKAMKVIMLIGDKDSGKTTTLNMVYDYLTKVVETKIIRSKTQLGGDPKDFECVLDYQGMKVAIFSMGDNIYDIIHAMSYYEGNESNILIVANRNKVYARKRLKRYPGSVEIMKTMPLSDASNKADMQAIIAEI